VPSGILIVDDNPHFLRTAERLLTMRGLNAFDLVGGGDEALAALDRGCPDGVLLDINLVGQDGFQVAAALAARCPTLPIVLMSSESDAVGDLQLKRCGATAFVPKTALATTDLGQFFGGKPPDA
jgi:two-component system nitrate/nitrite response regulator NarL